ESDAGVSFAGFANEVEPKLGLHNDEQRRAEMPKRAPNRPTPIERDIKDRIRILEDLSCELLAGSRSGRNDKPNVREFAVKAIDKRPRGICLANGDAMQPDGLSLVRHKWW